MRSVFGLYRTPNIRLEWRPMNEATELLHDALRQAGVADVVHPSRGPDADLAVVVGTTMVPITVIRRSLVSPDTVTALVGKPATGYTMIVADRITEDARRTLLEHGVGYYDLRGHLVLRTPALIVTATLEPLTTPRRRASVLTTDAGLQVATHLLSNPGERVGVRQLARAVSRAASTVSEVLTRLRDEQLVDGQGKLVGTDLFWKVADIWKWDTTYLRDRPPIGRDRATAPLRLNLDAASDSEGWALSGNAAAAAYGAPAASHTAEVLEFYVPDRTILRRASMLLTSVASPDEALAAVRYAPVPEICANRQSPRDNPWEFPLARPVIVALDLAQDRGRGVEILQAWTPSGGIRVW